MIWPHDTFLLWTTRGTALVPCNLSTVTDLQMNYSLLCLCRVLETSSNWIFPNLFRNISDLFRRSSSLVSAITFGSSC